MYINKTDHKITMGSLFDGIPCVEFLMERVAMVILLDLKWDF